MADTRQPRPSTDEEAAPLLQNVSHPEEGGSRPQPTPNRSFSQRVSSVVQEPLTPLTKILLVLLIGLLLLSSVFIGLFAGAQHKLNIGKGGKGGNGGGRKPGDYPTHTFTQTEHDTVSTTLSRTSTATFTATATTTAITTTVATQTSIGISTTTAVSTTTRVQTTTVGIPAPVPTGKPHETPCFSPNCIMLAADILASLDTTKDPCENFYDFATGGWLKAHPIPSDKGAFGHFDALSQQNGRLIQQILSKDSSSIYAVASQSESVEDPYDSITLGKLRGLYSSCMNEDLLDARGTEPLLHIIRNVRNLFHGKTTIITETGEEVEFVQHGVKEERDGLTAAIAYLHSRDIPALFSVDIEGDIGKDPNFMTLWFNQPTLGLPSKEYYEEEAMIEFYESVLKRVLFALTEDEEDEVLTTEMSSDAPVYEERLRVWPPWPWPPWDGEDPDHPDGPDGPGRGPGGPHKPENPKKRAKKLAKDIISFEKNIAAASLDLDTLLHDPVGTYNPVPIYNLTDSLPEINFNAYLSTMAPRAYPTRVIVTSTTYAPDLSSILRGTSRETIEAYLETRVALALGDYLGKKTEVWKAVRSLEEKLSGAKPGAVGDRAEYCARTVENAMGFAAGRYFVKEVFGGDSKEVGTKVITDIVRAFKKSLGHIKWMDEDSAKAAAEKADAIRVKVGFPLSPDTRNPRSIANYYGRVNIHHTTFFENVVSASMSDQVWKWLTLGKQRDPESWVMYPSQVNAYFEPPANEIVFPAGILQPPFFKLNWPHYMTYGSFGMVAAHELTHAFDTTGRMYNQEGKLEQWWTNKTNKGYKQLEYCIVEQYSSYTIDDGKGGKIHVNGNLTSGENIGDTGLIQAYRAWKTQYHDSFDAGTEFLLPGLPYTRDQLFFISFARIWAQNIKPESAISRVRVDSHAPHRYRVDGTVYNIPEFAQAFKCSSKAKLNPPQEKRCMFWS